MAFGLRPELLCNWVRACDPFRHWNRRNLDRSCVRGFYETDLELTPPVKVIDRKFRVARGLSQPVCVCDELFVVDVVGVETHGNAQGATGLVDVCDQFLCDSLLFGEAFEEFTSARCD